jgi:hypothetical protein
MPTALEQEIGHGNTGLVPWSAFVDVTETVAELAWPNSINTYSAMRTDAQIASLLLAFTLPIRRYHWYVDPNGARDEVVEDVANDFNLPIDGQDPKPATRRRDRFSHDRHLFHALLMLTYGHMFFEQVYRYDDAARRFRLRKLAPRMPGTISEIQIARDGGLEYIRQSAGLAEFGMSPITKASGTKRVLLTRCPFVGRLLHPPDAGGAAVGVHAARRLRDAGAGLEKRRMG